MYGFGAATFFILLDAFSGYHQIRLSKASIEKTAFFAPQGRKYVWVVMPFGLRNCPVIFLSMMHDLRELWTQLCEEAGVAPSDDKGSTIIMDDTFLFSASEDNAFIIVRCVCILARKYNLTWKLAKSRWFPDTVEFVGVDVSKKGNAPASSKNKCLRNWKNPDNPRDIMAFIGFAIFYVRWIPFFELKVQPLRELISTTPLDRPFRFGQYTSVHQYLYDDIKARILSAPILQRADIKKRFYLKTDFSSKGLGFALCQPDDSENALAAMKREDTGGPCEFDLLTKIRATSTPYSVWFSQMHRQQTTLPFAPRRMLSSNLVMHQEPTLPLGTTFYSHDRLCRYQLADEL
jgi:hypothetical protein